MIVIMDSDSGLNFISVEKNHFKSSDESCDAMLRKKAVNLTSSKTAFLIPNHANGIKNVTPSH